MGKRGKAAAAAAEATAAPPPLRKPRSKTGAAEAKAAAEMTTEEWKKLQVGMAEKWPAPVYMLTDVPRRGPTAYRDETYAMITRWMAETKISYRPHAKSPGSKSHLRYEHYSAAKTVAQALDLGTFPQDWCWDYERGFIQVEGPLRDEPIDITQVTSDVQLTEVDQIIYRWYNKELAKNLGLDYRDLFGTTDPSIVRAHRLVALREAKQRLADAEKEGRSVSDEDVAACLKAWAFMKNAARQNVIPGGQKWVWSDTIGLIRDRCGNTHITPPTKLYPEFIQLIVKWLIDRLPPEAANFTFTSMNLNCNYAAKIHRDGNNFGPSFIKAFGDFKGGALNYWPEDDKSCELENLTADQRVQLHIGPGPNGGLALFNGNSAHSVEDFQGNRYSVVYFTLGSYMKAPAEDKAYLEFVGIPLPLPDEDRCKVLRAPRGYAAKAPGLVGETPGKESKPPVMFFKNEELVARRGAKRRSTSMAETPDPEDAKVQQALFKRAVSASEAPP